MHTITLEVFRHKSLVIHLEIILHILQCCIVVANHQVGIFAYNVHLLNLLSIELIQHTIVFLLVTKTVILDATDVHGVIEYKKTSFQFQRAYLRQVEQCLFYVLQLHIPKPTEKSMFLRFEIFKQLHHRELDTIILRFLCCCLQSEFI